MTQFRSTIQIIIYIKQPYFFDEFFDVDTLYQEVVMSGYCMTYHIGTDMEFISLEVRYKF